MNLAYKYRDSLSPKSSLELQWDANKKLERDMKMEEFKQAGQLKLENMNQQGQTLRTGMNNASDFSIADRNQMGETGRTAMNNASNWSVANLRDRGETNRANITEGGLNTRQGAALRQNQGQFDRSQGLEEYKAFDVKDEFGVNTNDPTRAAGFSAWMNRGKNQDRLLRIPAPVDNGLNPNNRVIAPNNLTQGTFSKVDAAPKTNMPSIPLLTEEEKRRNTARIIQENKLRSQKAQDSIMEGIGNTWSRLRKIGNRSE